MADVADGQVDPNEDFQAALAQAAGVEATEQTEKDVDTSVSAGLTGLTEETQQRDEGGRFAPAATDSGEKTPAAVPEEGQTAEGEETTVDPAVASWLQQHDGDAEAALAALVKEREHAQSLIGTQGNKLGEMERQLAELQGYVSALGQNAEPVPDLPLANDDLVEGLETLHEQRGARGMMEWVIEHRPDLIDTAEQVWAAEDPVTAAGFRARREAFQVLGSQEAAAAPPTLDPVLESMRQERALGDTIDQVRAELAISDEDWAAVRDQITPAFEDDSTPSLIRNAVVSNDPTQQYEGMKNLMQVARSRALAASTASATEQASTAAAAQAAERKQAARVATGSLRPAGAATPGQPAAEMSKEDRTKAFHEALLKTEVTSVADGLTGLS